jgi:opacity protein-like surface antigen
LQKLVEAYAQKLLREILTMRRIAIMIASVAVFLGGSAAAQEARSEIGAQGTGFFTTDTTGPGTTQRSTYTGGLLVGYRYSFNRWLAAEGVYGYNRNTQEYIAPVGFARVQSNIHQATGGLAFRLPAPARFRFSPYLLAEGGALIFDPTGNAFASVAAAQRQATGVFAYGGGTDFPLFRHVALRAEYRGLAYRAPDFGLSTLNTNAIIHTAEPSAGIVFRF